MNLPPTSPFISPPPSSGGAELASAGHRASPRLNGKTLLVIFMLTTIIIAIQAATRYEQVSATESSFTSTVDNLLLPTTIVSLQVMDGFTVNRAGPRLNLSGNEANVVNGTPTASLENHTDFGAIAVTHGVTARTFTLTNGGDAPLNLNGMPLAVLSGPHADDFFVLIAPDPVIPPGGSTSFTLTCDPSAPGPRSAVLSIATDTKEFPHFAFAVEATGLGAGE